MPFQKALCASASWLEQCTLQLLLLLLQLQLQLLLPLLLLVNIVDAPDLCHAHAAANKRRKRVLIIGF